MYTRITATGFLSTAYFNKSLCMCIPLSLRGNGEINLYHGNEYTRNNRRIVERVIFYVVRVVSMENIRLVLPTDFCFFVVDFNYIEDNSAQTRPLVREGATKLQKRNCLKKISRRELVAGPRWAPDTKSGWPTDCRS
jgi:hypothetical protein